ncbi:zinc finger protein 239-like [Narcine bancroftii]|uniref:zinc finger protein 239-like n=1 Tax=Narcine bancroftii TaxID=1343680 RepID=UPI003831DF48
MLLPRSRHWSQPRGGFNPLPSSLGDFIRHSINLFQCSACGQTFKRSSPHQAEDLNLLQVEKWFHPVLQPVDSPAGPHRGECGKGFTQVSHQWVHSGERLFTCPECRRGFTLSSHLQIHQQVHTGERTFICPECRKGFAWSSHLLRHQQVHTKERQFTCSKRRKEFT